MTNWIYRTNTDNTARYVLGTSGEKTLVCIGVNPSTAEPDNLDNTLKSVLRIAHKNGYDSFVMLNLYPQRATNPNDMHKVYLENLRKENILEIKNLLDSMQNFDIWASWGTLITKRSYLLECLIDIVDIIMSYDTNWITFGNRSKAGHPHHPLYLRNDVISEKFDILEYLINIKPKQET